MGPFHFRRANRQFARKSNKEYGFARKNPKLLPESPPCTPMVKYNCYVAILDLKKSNYNIFCYSVACTEVVNFLLSYMLLVYNVHIKLLGKNNICCYFIQSRQKHFWLSCTSTLDIYHNKLHHVLIQTLNL